MPTKFNRWGKPQNYDPTTGRYGESSNKSNKGFGSFEKPINNKTLRLFDKKTSDIIHLTKQEWARYYAMISGELHGDFFYHTTKKERWVIVDTKVIIDNGLYIKPKVKKVLVFETEDIMADYIDKMIAKGIIK